MLCADADHYRAQLHLEQDRLARLAPLCECVDAPQQECPIHGDGVTFVAHVQALEAVAVVARAVALDAEPSEGHPATALVAASELDRLDRALRTLDGA